MKGNKKFDILGFREVWNDIVNYRDWIKTLKFEKRDPNSNYNKFELESDWFKNLYILVTLPDEDLVLPEKIQKLRVIEILKPVNQYLGDDLLFSEYLAPDFTRVFEDDEPTLKFMIIYRFMFRRLTWNWLFSRSLLLGGLTYAGLNWESIYGWISNLI